MPPDRLALGALALALAASAGLAAARRVLAARDIAWAAAVALLATLVLRWIRSGHPPVFGTFEMDLAETLVLLVLGLAVTRGGDARWIAGPSLVGSLTILHTFMVRTEITPRTISEQSLWIDLHAVLAWVAWAAFFGALFDAFGDGRGEERGLRLLGAGFLAQTGMGFVGVYYASLLFATPWSWDPVQTLGLLSWLLFGVALHFRLFFGVSLRRMRYFLLVLVAVHVLSGKLPMLLKPGQTFHVFELGAFAEEGR